MERSREYTISVLKDLLSLCKEEKSLFNSAIEKIEDRKIKDNFINCANEKAEFICKIESEIKRLGGSLETLEETKSGEHFKPSNKIINAEQDSIVHYCLEKDNSILSRYSTAMNEDIMWEVVPLIAKQYFDSKNLHDRIMLTYLNRQQKNLVLGNSF